MRDSQVVIDASLLAHPPENAVVLVGDERPKFEKAGCEAEKVAEVPEWHDGRHFTAVGMLYIRSTEYDWPGFNPGHLSAAYIRLIRA